MHSHPLWQHCASTLQEISDRDYPSQKYFKSLPAIDALDLDTYEKSLHKGKSGNQACTGDAVMGIALRKAGDHLVEQSLLLVELRMGYTNGDNLELENIRKKVEHSRDLLNENGSSPIYKDYFFIFTDTEASQANSKIRRKANEIGRMTNYKVLSVSNFKACLVDPAELSYHPQHPAIDIINWFLPAYSQPNNIDITVFEKAFNHWLKIFNQCKQNYKIQEAEHILYTLKNELSRAKRILNDPSSDAHMVIEIMEEELV